jgi:hypothetical protein
MGLEYWLYRSSVAAMMARRATSAEARLIHYDLAGRYSVKAASSPAMLPPWPEGRAER